MRSDGNNMIDEIAASRDTDALIAKNVMGWKSITKRRTGDDYTGYNPGGVIDYVPHYSTGIEAAWEVVEKMRERYTFCELSLASHADKMITFNINHYSADYTGLADTAPLAICRAALKAMEVDTDTTR